MDIRHLQHVLLLAEELNFSRAAERAHLTQSAFSRSIQTAEMQAGVKFFDRTQRSVKPTAVGKRIIERGRSILYQKPGISTAKSAFSRAGMPANCRLAPGRRLPPAFFPA